MLVLVLGCHHAVRLRSATRGVGHLGILGFLVVHDCDGMTESVGATNVMRLYR